MEMENEEMEAVLDYLVQTKNFYSYSSENLPISNFDEYVPDGIVKVWLRKGSVKGKPPKQIKVKLLVPKE